MTELAFWVAEKVIEREARVPCLPGDFLGIEPHWKALRDVKIYDCGVLSKNCKREVGVDSTHSSQIRYLAVIR
jgi:hypothetical protein